MCAYWGYREIVLTCSVYQFLSASLYKLEKASFFLGGGGGGGCFFVWG